MRSDVVHRALGKVANRYLLCRATAKLTRYVHSLSTNSTDAISDALTTISYGPYISCLEDSYRGSWTDSAHVLHRVHNPQNRSFSTRPCAPTMSDLRWIHDSSDQGNHHSKPLH